MLTIGIQSLSFGRNSNGVMVNETKKNRGGEEAGDRKSIRQAIRWFDHSMNHPLPSSKQQESNPNRR